MATAADPSGQAPPRSLGAADRLALLGACGLIGLIAVRFHNYQWDFNMFCWSADDFLHGLSPYKGQGLSFYHPPLTLFLYSLFQRIPFPFSYELWLSLKLAALVGLFAIWSRRFLKLEASWPVTLYFVFAYNAALYADLVSGNVSTFEELGLWFAFASLLEGRYGRFCLCMALVAQFKLTPIFLSCMLLVVPERRQWKWFAVCIGLFGALLCLNYVVEPALTRDFFRVAPALDERGTQSPGTLAFVRDALDMLRGPHFSDRSHVDELTFL